MSKSVKGCNERVRELKCQSCGQTVIYLNAIGCGHSVCDDCCGLWNESGSFVCPLPSCNKSTHVKSVAYDDDATSKPKSPCPMASEIKLQKEDLEKCKNSHENAFAEVVGQISTINQQVNKLNVDVSEIQMNIKDIKMEVGSDMQEMKIEMDQLNKSRQVNKKEDEMEMNETIEDFKKQMEDLVMKIHSVVKHSKQVEEKMKNESEDNKNLKVENHQISKENSKLKEKLKQVENEYQQFQLTAKLNKEEMLEKISRIDNSLPHFNFPQINQFNLIDQYDRFQPIFSWKIDGIKEKLKRHTFIQWSDTFSWTGYPVTARAKLEFKKGESIYMSMDLKETKAEDAKTVKIVPMVFYLLKDRSGKEIGLHKIRSKGYLIPIKFSTSLKFENYLVLKSWLNDGEYNADDAVVIEIYVESPMMTQSIHSHDGTLNWAITNCEKRRQLEKECLIDSQESPSFYTDAKGYRVQVRLMLNGSGKHYGKGPSASIRFQQGEYDSLRPFFHRTTLTVFNPKYPERHITKTIKEDIVEKSSYNVDICEWNEFTNFIENDIVYVRVKVRPRSMFEWLKVF